MSKRIRSSIRSTNKGWRTMSKGEGRGKRKGERRQLRGKKRETGGSGR